MRGAGDVLHDDDDGVEDEVAPEDGVEDVEEGVAGSVGDEDPQPLDEDGGFDEAHVGAEYVDGEEDVLGGMGLLGFGIGITSMVRVALEVCLPSERGSAAPC